MKPVLLYLQEAIREEDWSTLSSAFEENGFQLVLQLSPSLDSVPKIIAGYHPEAAILVPVWDPSSPNTFAVDLFTAVSPILPTVTVINRYSYPWLNHLFQPPLHEYVTTPFDSEELIHRVKDVIRAKEAG